MDLKTRAFRDRRVHRVPSWSVKTIGAIAIIGPKTVTSGTKSANATVNDKNKRELIRTVGDRERELNREPIRLLPIFVGDDDGNVAC